MKRKILGGLLLILVVTASVLYAIAPPALLNQASIPVINGDLDVWLAEQESKANAIEAIIPETEKRVRWYHNNVNHRTAYSVVYLHGFSATRQEIVPVGEMVADELKANLFETRLAGHGQTQHALEGVRAEDWLEDAAEALTIGAQLGEQVILMGTSTGATLALAMAGHPAFKDVSDIVLLSPNFAPSDPKAELLTWPGGPQLAYLIAGDTHTWIAENELQGHFWSLSYPMDAAIEMMRLVKFVRRSLPLQLQQPVLAIYSPNDTVVDTAWIIKGFDQIDSPGKQLIEINKSANLSNHVIAGNIMAPQNNQLFVDYITDFVLE